MLNRNVDLHTQYDPVFPELLIERDNEKAKPREVRQLQLPKQSLWNRLSKHPAVMPCARWFALVTLANLACLLWA